MKNLRVGVWITNDLVPETGGGHGYYMELLRALNNHDFKDAEIIFLSDRKISVHGLKIQRLTRSSRQLKFWHSISSFLAKKRLLSKITLIPNKAIDKSRKEIYRYVDIIYYLTPHCAYPDFPYVFTLWDLGYMNTYAFPEISMNEKFEIRKKYLNALIPKALMIFTESNTGKEQCKKYLAINEDRIRVVPIFPSGVIDPACISIKPTTIKDDIFFIHYPAQYWAHKNHYNLLIAMSIVVKKVPQIKLVLTGSDKGNKDYILNAINELKMEKNVLDLGFVSTEELKWLYENSQGLVMPTLLGPTNMPLLEAAELGCSVACTNLPGHIEQLGEYGYYFSGLRPEDIAKQIILMINNNKSGMKKTYTSKFNINNAIKAIDDSFSELKNIRFCWGKNDRIS